MSEDLRVLVADDHADFRTGLVAMLGGTVGTRYHSRVDRAARRTGRRR